MWLNIMAIKHYLARLADAPATKAGSGLQFPGI